MKFTIVNHLSNKIVGAMSFLPRKGEKIIFNFISYEVVDIAYKITDGHEEPPVVLVKPHF